MTGSGPHSARIERFIDSQVKFYSTGMYVRLAFAVAVHVDPDVLLVDEVLAVGDEPFQRKCMDKIRSFQFEGRTIVLVSHSLDQVGDLCDRVVVLESGEVRYDGPTAAGLRVLREEFQATSLGRALDLGFGTRHRIEKTELLDATTGQPVSLVTPGQSLRFDVTVASDDPLDDWVVGTGIDTPLGHVVFGTNTRLLGNTNTRLEGTKTVSFLLPEVRLGNGRYFVHASFGTRSDESALRLEQLVAFDSEDGTGNIGAASIHASFDVV